MTTPDSLTPPAAPATIPPKTPRLDEARAYEKTMGTAAAAGFMARHSDEIRAELAAVRANADVPAGAPPVPPTSAAPVAPTAAPAPPAGAPPPVPPAIDHVAAYRELQRANPYLAQQYLLNHQLEIYPHLALPPKVKT